MLHASTSVPNQTHGSSPTVPDDRAAVDLLNHSTHTQDGKNIPANLLSLMCVEMTHKPFFISANSPSALVLKCSLMCMQFQ